MWAIVNKQTKGIRRIGFGLFHGTTFPLIFNTKEKAEFVLFCLPQTCPQSNSEVVEVEVKVIE